MKDAGWYWIALAFLTFMYVQRTSIDLKTLTWLIGWALFFLIIWCRMCSRKFDW